MKIASFNIQRFGCRKMKNKTFVTTFLKIINRYDIVVILELVDVSGRCLDMLADALKDSCYQFNVSKRLGRGRYKEQYLILYKACQVTLEDTYQYDDINEHGEGDVFSRDPYIVKFKLHSNCVIDTLVIIPIHTKPVDSTSELNALQEVVHCVQQIWKTDNIMIMGDFNADGSYVNNTTMKQICIRKNNCFYWLIDDDMDTTTRTSNDYTYDRIVACGHRLYSAVVKNSAKPFNFQKAYRMSERDALFISDHYPVEVTLLKRW
ncbi:Deoxyribonuclease-1 [Scale drop disease virus]|nr:Deoxyribonuclease-1 [Scale drop disease virus]QXJ13636.1 ORF047R [Scale drop disease virus]UNH60738.1 Deoxyribonuclease-1 [Scale drop disease virus]